MKQLRLVERALITYPRQVSGQNILVETMTGASTVTFNDTPGVGDTGPERTLRTATITVPTAQMVQVLFNGNCRRVTTPALTAFFIRTQINVNSVNVFAGPSVKWPVGSGSAFERTFATFAAMIQVSAGTSVIDVVGFTVHDHSDVGGVIETMTGWVVWG